MDRSAAAGLTELAQKSFDGFGEATRSVLDILGDSISGCAMVASLNFARAEFRVIEVGGDDFAIASGYTLPIAESPCFHMVGGKGPQISNDATVDPVYGPLKFTRSWSVRSYAGAPIELSDGAPVGSVCAISRQQAGFTEQDLESLSIAARVLSYEWEHSARDIELARLRGHRSDPASTDAITGLMKPESFLGALRNECKAAQQGLTESYLALFEIEQGDVAGEGAGPLIKVAARVVDRQARRTDVAGRIDFKRLGVVLVDCKEEAGARDFCERAVEAFAQAEEPARSAAALKSELHELSAFQGTDEVVDLAING